MVTDKSLWGKIWYFIWEDESAWSWIVNIILAYVLIKFMVYPGLSLLLTTSHPIVAVVSGSMEHDGGFNEWWKSSALCSGNPCTQEEFYASYGISSDDFLSYKFRNGFNKGDIMVLYGSSSANLKVGDVLVFLSTRPDPIIHRIIKVNNVGGSQTFQTKGDHNSNSIAGTDLDEFNIGENQLIGKAVFRIPYLGYVKIWFVDLINLFI